MKEVDGVGVDLKRRAKQDGLYREYTETRRTNDQQLLLQRWVFGLKEKGITWLTKQ